MHPNISYAIINNSVPFVNTSTSLLAPKNFAILLAGLKNFFICYYHHRDYHNYCNVLSYVMVNFHRKVFFYKPECTKIVLHKYLTRKCILGISHEWQSAITKVAVNRLTLAWIDPLILVKESMFVVNICFKIVHSKLYSSKSSLFQLKNYHDKK